MLMWFRTWLDDDRRLWADRQQTGDPADGKRDHTADRTFRWVTGDMHAPTVTPLEFTDEHGYTRLIAAGNARDNQADRDFLRAAHPAPVRPAPTPEPTAPAPAPAPDDDLPF